MKDAKGHGSNKGIGAQGMRKLKTHTNGPHSASVYNNPEWGEKVVKFFQNGVYQPKADYHTNDTEDAHATARAGLSRYASLDRDTAAKTITAGSAAPVHDSMMNIGDRVHLGLGAKGGAGFFGKLTKNEGGSAEIQHDNGKTYKGPSRFLSK